MSKVTTGIPELVASGLGWPEGPTALADGSLVFVEQYRSQLTVVAADGKPRRFAYTMGSPNSCEHTRSPSLTLVGGRKSGPHPA